MDTRSGSRVSEHPDKIANLHWPSAKDSRGRRARTCCTYLKNRLKNHREPHTDENTTEWGKGDAPLREV
jgi:hypothetical protein